MAVALKSLRVSADMDTSGYVRAAQAKVDADNRMIASDKARNAALAQADAALAKAVPGVGGLSKTLLEGYGAGAQFEAIVRRIGAAVERGMGLDRMNLLLDGAYKKFGLTADAALLAEKNMVPLAAAVAALNEQYSIHAEVAARATTATEQASAAARAQASINSQFGIGGDSRSAQDSAEAFLAQFGGLEGIAKARAAEAGAAFAAELQASFTTGIAKSARESASVFEAEMKRLETVAQQRADQIGQAFAQDLDNRLIAGSSKSARDAASVFEAEISRIETIAQQKAQQAGANFQSSLNQAMGIGGPSAASNGATYSALAEQIERLDQIEQLRASHQAQVTQQLVATAYGYDSVSKSARDAASVFMEAAQAEEQAAAKAAALRAQINPLEAEMGRLGKEMAEYRSLLNQGLISSSEFEQAQSMAAKRLSDVDMSMRNAATGGRVLSGELANLGYQVNDVVTGLMLGQPLFMIAAQQGGQVYQIFSRSKASVGEFAASYWNSIVGMVTPTRAAFGAVVAIVGTGIAALNSYVSAQDKVKLALTGAGAASGATVASINSTAKEGASPFGLSVSSARDLASALAETGKVANDNFMPIVKLGRDFATTFGVSDVEATKTLAQAFADPAKGAEQLNDRLGFLDAGMQRQIASLMAQNRLYDAQRVLLQGVQGSLAKTTEVTSVWSQAWLALKNSTSDFWDYIGEKLANAGGLNASLEQQRDNLNRLIADYNNPFSPGSMGGGSDLEALKRQLSDINALIEKRAAATRDVASAQASLRVSQTIMSQLPEIQARQALQDAASVGGSTAEDPVLMQKLGLTQSQADRARNILQQLKNDFKTTFEEIQTNAKIAYDAVTAFSPSAKAAIAQRQAFEQYRAAGGLDPSEKARIGQDAYNLSLRQTITNLSEAARVRALSANQAVDSERLEIELIGKTVGQQAELRANLQARQQLEQEASANRTAFDQKQYEDLKKINAELGRQTDLAARAAVNDNIRFGRQTSLLSPDDVQIAQQLRGIYPDVATALNSVEAQGLRTNAALSQLSSTVSGQLTTGLADIVDGTKSISQGFQDMSKLVIRAIEEMIIKIAIIQPMMQSLQQGMNSLGLGGGIASLFGGGGGLPGTAGSAFYGPVAPSALGNVFSLGNIVPFARGGIFGGPTIFPMANGGTGLAGEAGPEAIMPLRRGPDGRLGVSAGAAANDNRSSGGVVVNVVNQTGVQAEVSTSRNANGDVTVRLRKMMDDSVGQSISSGTGSRVLRSQYGVRQFMGS